MGGGAQKIRIELELCGLAGAWEENATDRQLRH
jgi:hypothetical protein